MRSISENTSLMTLIILSSIGLVVMYIETMVSPALPDFIKEFKISYNIAPWILTSYLVVAVVMTPVMGRLSDIYGRKKILLIGLIIYAFGTFGAGFANNIYFMLIARAAEGIGIGIFPVAVSIVRDQSSEKQLAFNQGIITSMFATGAVIGLAAGGPIIHYFGWRATFFTIMPLVIALIIFVIRFIHDNDQVHAKNNKDGHKISFPKFKKTIFSQSKIDINGAIVFSIGIVSVLLIITNIQDKMSYVNWIILSILSIISITSFAVFAYIEKKSLSPLIDLKLIMNKILLSANVLRMIAGLIMFTILNTMPILIRNPKPIGFGENAFNTAMIIVPFMVAYLIIGVSSGIILSRLGNIRVIIMGSIICVFGFTIMMSLFQNFEILFVGLAILGIGSQLLHQGAININLVSTPKSQTGISFGISNVFYLMGSAIGPTIVGMFMQANKILLPGLGSFPSFNSYVLIFETGLILSTFSILLSIFILNKFRGPKVIPQF
ncbi:MAG TPA: MFS transporter [Candidatus Nitrosocosmicus sp.]